MVRRSLQPISDVVGRAAEALLFLRIVCFATVVPLLLRMRLPIVERILRPKARRGFTDPHRIRRIISFTEIAIDVGMPFIRRSCLVRGTTLYYFLSRAGLEVSLCFGVGQVGAKFAGHCWLVKDGEPYLEKQDPRQMFTAVYRFPNGDGFPAIVEPTEPAFWIVR